MTFTSRPPSISRQSTVQRFVTTYARPLSTNGLQPASLLRIIHRPAFRQLFTRRLPEKLTAQPPEAEQAAKVSPQPGKRGAGRRHYS